MYRLVATDLDGTLFNQYSKMSGKTLQAVEGLKAKGIAVAIASGRTCAEIAGLVKPLGLETYSKGYFLGYNGVIARKADTREVLFRKMIHGEDVRRIARWAEFRGMKLHVFAEDRIYLSEGIELLLGSDPELMGAAPRIKASEYAGSDEVYKVLILEADERLNEFQRNLPEDLKSRYTVFKSASHLLEFVHKDASKGRALAEVASSLGIPPSEVMAFGDEENDISMLEYAGMGVAMDNAKPAVKKAAKRIAMSNRLDGVAEMINREILEVELT